MASVSFTLAPEAILQFHDILVCLAKFNDAVSIEAEHDFLRFSTLNATKSGYASFRFDATSFFNEYSFDGSRRGSAMTSNARSGARKLSCQIYIKALLSVFKGRSLDFKDKDTAVERCEVQIFDEPDETECRAVIRMICKHGVVKTSKLTYESVEVKHAVFDKSKTKNKWAINSKFLREIVEYFEILKKPVHTSVSINIRDFEECAVEERLHVATSVKDFKAIIIHADTLKTLITARYTKPCRPLQLSYQSGGVTCEFTLMTRGEAGDADAASNADTRELSAMPYSKPPQTASVNDETNVTAAEIDAPENEVVPRPFHGAAIQDTPQELPPIGASFDRDSLFVPLDDDRQWDEPQYEEEQEDILGWDANLDQGSMQARLVETRQDHPARTIKGEKRDGEFEPPAIPPTQRISQIRGLFD
ncbi:hypothetical protein LOZ53_002838 [Ophidiomyces ophidiicola]|uniref:Uncharacterized protein n=1 Tax=Ophidiomyces ophidiicola TaxID=1387563 RepID=A0ACB8UTU9_9EURO|nr:uncharacterized protein LOZ57_006429 [Ophidiomyces ophidiicola]KAI1909801.1 hypothetical protein LOZ64_005141 [Ophidiomyces ophidiicola]KAI1910842.1 hypothetical protein LOZ61_004184 [Ophidiomyces ophidiicola]KAI1923515.1 hypothetical protein LOZ60_005183 [Ophidiomyces ophidiicola]KAI1938260.1 hypothetical protein LOZ57_006429 [Ophidiomyces ophidiicola]KAI1944157.1 hypothetical protein LOZ62_004288 [Ophidiomyces ophidiicola]